jgi:uncharacterized repeat protein (TIGR03843 family)
VPEDERPPAAGRLIGWRPGAGPELGSVPELLRASDLSVAGRLPWSSNLTFLVTLEADSVEPLHAVYKPGRGERSLWDFPDGLYRREVVAYGLSEALGWGLVPPTVERVDAPYGPGSLQLFVEADYEQHYFTLLESGAHRDTLLRVCAFDVVANNADRKSGHVLEGDSGRLWAIDHGLCFHRHPKLRTVIWDFACERVPPAILADLTRLEAALPPELEELLSGAESAAVSERIDRLVHTGVFPEPVGEHPPYPWPLV